MTGPARSPSDTEGPFVHELFTYADDTTYIQVVTDFVRDGVARGEPVLVAVPASRLSILHGAQGVNVDAVQFVDIAQVGDNPARIIAMWRAFVDAADGRPCRGVGEPIFAGRDEDEVVECLLHEHLLNVAFADDRLHLLCPYDLRQVGSTVLASANGTHPWIHQHGLTVANPAVGRPWSPDDTFRGDLPPPPSPVEGRTFDGTDLADLRTDVRSTASAAGIPEAVTEDLVLAVDELASNVIVHGGPVGRARWWIDEGTLVCEVAGPGRFTEPLVGRLQPPPETTGGRGLWLANQLCGLVQIRNFGGDTVVRVRSRRDGAT